MESADWSTGQTGAPQLVEGYNRPMLFDSTNDYVNCGASNALVTGNILSVSGWVRTVDTDKGRVFQGQKSAGSTSYSLIVNDNGGVATAGYVSCLTFNGLSVHNYVSYDASIDDGAWHHLAMTTTASAQKLYVDGALVASGATTFGNTVSADKAVIGSLDGTDEFVGGVINEVVLYDSELTLAQVQALAATGPNGGPLPPDAMSLSNSSDVVAYWRNDGNVTWADRAGSANGTVNGSPSALLFKQGINGSASTSTGRDGQGFPLLYKNNGAVGFSGALTDEGIRVTGIDPTALSYITVSAWVKIVGNTNWGTIAMQADTNSFDEGWGLNFNGTSDQFQFWVDIYTDPAQADISSHYGKWLHVVGTYNGTDQKLYFNGVEVDSEADTWTNKGSATNEIHVGTGIGTANTIFRYGLNGQIANLQIYNRALSYAEIQQNYNAQKSRFT
jgi:hypothetical protein